MREFPEVLAQLAAPTSTGTPSWAISASGCQVHQPVLHTRCFYGYLIGEETDTLLCGHPDLLY